MRRIILILLVIFLLTNLSFAPDFGVRANLSTPQNNTSSLTGIVTASALNIRSTPNGRILGSVYKGDQVTITGESGTWYKIDWNGKTAYVFKKYVSLSGGATSGSKTSSNPLNVLNTNPNRNTSSSSSATRIGYVTASSLNLRTAPWGKVILSMPNGSRVKVLGKSGSWYKVSYSGRIGFAWYKYISFTSSQNMVSATSPARSNSANVSGGSSQSKKIVNIARSYLGSTQFRGREVEYGKKACALYVSTVLKDAGILSRTETYVPSLIEVLKSKGWREVSPPPWKEGDIATWYTYNRGTGGKYLRDTHIGIIGIGSSGPYAMSNSSSRRYPRIHSVNYQPLVRVLRAPWA